MKPIDTLRRFVAPQDCERELFREPFLFESADGNKYPTATDMHILCRFKHVTPDCAILLSAGEPNVDSVIPTETCTGILNVDRLKESLGKVPMSQTCTCPECGGAGRVRYEYKSKKGDIYYYYPACPICAGEGEVDREEDGSWEYDFNYGIKIDNATFWPKYLIVIATALFECGIAEIPYVIASNRLKLENEVFVMLQMANVFDFKHIIEY